MTKSQASKIDFYQKRIIEWSKLCSKQYPWRSKDVTPFQILIVEIFLEKASASSLWNVYDKAVKPFRFPKDLAKIESKTYEELVLPLGLRSSAKKIMAIAKHLLNFHEGQIPEDVKVLRDVRGIGKYTVAAVSTLAFGRTISLLDADSMRVHARFFGLKKTRQEQIWHDDILRELATNIHLSVNASIFLQGSRDLALTICTRERPRCTFCPLRRRCNSRRTRDDEDVYALDLYAGAGGLASGARKAGITTVYSFERDAMPAMTFEHNFPSTAVAKVDLTLRSAKWICNRLGIVPNSVDILMGGPPCQGFSTSNMHTRNSSNPDNSAWKRVIAFAAIVKPKAVIIENVGGILTFDDGRVSLSIIARLKSLGYRVNKYEINAVDCGVPQNRRRIFFLAVKKGNLPITFPSLGGVPTTVGEAIGDLPKVANGNQISEKGYRVHGSSLTSFQRTMRNNNSKLVRNCITSKNSSLTIKRFKCVKQGENWSVIPAKLFKTYAKKENCHRWLYKRLSENAPSVTINNFRKNMLIHPHEDRTLTVREAARLQGIDDSFVFFGGLHSQQQQVANAVPPPLAEAVVRLVLLKLQLAKKRRKEMDARF